MIKMKKIYRDGGNIGIEGNLKLIKEMYETLRAHIILKGEKSMFSS